MFPPIVGNLSQPNLAELNADINAMDIVTVLDAAKQGEYAFGRPSPCPSKVTLTSTTGTTPTVCVPTLGPAAGTMPRNKGKPHRGAIG